MQAQDGTDVLRLMLLDILREAELLRPHDPVRTAHLDDAANDLRAVIAERAALRDERSESRARH